MYILLAALLSMAPAGDPEYTSITLTIGERADHLLAQDMSGDGRPDLVVQSGLELRFFTFHPDRGFRDAPDLVLRLEANTFLWTLATFCDSPQPTVTTASSRGIHRYVRTDGGFSPKPQDLIIHPSIFEGPLAPGKAPLYFDFMRNLTGDPLADAVLFARGEILVMMQEPDPAGQPSFRLAQKLAVPIDAGLLMLFGPHQQVREVTSVPIIAFGDINADELPDISYYLNETIGTYFQQPDGRFATDDPRAVGERRKRRNTYLRFEVPPQIIDLNGDHLLDVLVVYASKGRAHIYLNHGGKLDFTNPTSVLAIDKAWSAGAYAHDLDHDGTLEIVLTFVRKFGIIGGIDAFISKKIDLELHVFRYDPQRVIYPNEPVQQLTFSVPYTFTATRESASVDLTFRPYFAADIDGDRRLDLLVEKDGRTLGIYYGTQGSLIRDQEGGTLTFHPPADCVSTQPFSADFNGDGRSDLVLRHVLEGQKRHAVELLLSRR
ncbi:MAG: VCBS repeat-containing protein [Planctomycetes bacterium]|nr:VCBS repeat-containing protein [Planctomycetota bacterium]